MIRWCVMRGLVTLVPSDCDRLQNTLASELIEPLGDEVMRELEALNEDLKTSWKPPVEVDDD